MNLSILDELQPIAEELQLHMFSHLLEHLAKEMNNQEVSNKSYEALRIELEQKRQLKIQKRKAKHRGK
ncbi:hypothetical protein [Bacillus mycoides]|uniref:hypothetical protein n=1 Tax=Bacillus mycoides TaxID=1405 RepID=UPI0035585B41